MSDAEWAVIEPLLPAPGWTRGRGGSPGRYCRRDIVNGIRYLVHNGPVWRALPADLPHWRTVCHYVRAWQESGAAIIDSQSVKGSPAPMHAVLEQRPLDRSKSAARKTGYRRQGMQQWFDRVRGCHRDVSHQVPAVGHVAQPGHSHRKPAARSTGSDTK